MLQEGQITRIDHLRYFIEIGESKSLSEAARRLFISQQGLNKAASAMEAELGVKLFTRSPGGVRLTSKGVSFLSCAQDIVTRYDAALSEKCFFRQTFSLKLPLAYIMMTRFENT